MTLLAVIAALVLERLLAHLEHLREPRWFDAYLRWWRARLGGGLWDGPAGVLAVLAPPVAALALAQLALGGLLWGLGGLALGVVALLYCLGPRDLDAEARRFAAAWEAGETERARAALETLAGRAPEEPPERWPAAAARAVTAAAVTRVFGVLFWFALLGPAGALLYRLAVLLAEAAREWGGGMHEAAVTLREILDWVPVRLTLAGYALAGDFEETVHAWRERRGEGVAGDLALLGEAGAAALDLEPEEGAEAVEAALGLVWRTVIVWVTLIAVLTLAGLAA